MEAGCPATTTGGRGGSYRGLNSRVVQAHPGLVRRLLSGLPSLRVSSSARRRKLRCERRPGPTSRSASRSRRRVGRLPRWGSVPKGIALPDPDAELDPAFHHLRHSILENSASVLADGSRIIELGGGTSARPWEFSYDPLATRLLTLWRAPLYSERKAIYLDQARTVLLSGFGYSQ
jgi:hypothetical protein